MLSQATPNKCSEEQKHERYEGEKGTCWEEEVEWDRKSDEAG